MRLLAQFQPADVTVSEPCAPKPASPDDPEEEFYGPGQLDGDTTSVSELDAYLEEACAPADSAETEPLEWWKAAEGWFPLLSRVARSVLCIPASSATSERAFSAAGYIINKRRVNIHPDNVNKLLFIKSAYGLDPFA